MERRKRGITNHTNERITRIGDQGQKSKVESQRSDDCGFGIAGCGLDKHKRTVPVILLFFALILSFAFRLAPFACLRTACAWAAAYNFRATSAVNAGDVVVWDSATAYGVKTTTSQGLQTVAGVAAETVAAGNDCTIRQDGGRVTVNVTGTVMKGQWLVTSTVAGKAMGASSLQAGIFGYAITDSGTPGPGQVYASVNLGYLGYGAGTDASSLRGRTIAVTSPLNGQVYAWNATSEQWEPSDVAGGGAMDLDDLTDVTVSSYLAGRVLRANGSAFVDAQLGHSDLSGVGTNTHAQIDSHIAAAAPHSGHAATSHTHTESQISDLDHDAVKVMGKAFDDTGLADGKIWKYEAAAQTWKIADDAGGGAPTDAPYVTTLPNGTLTNEFALSTLANGLLRHTSGTPARAVPGTDYDSATARNVKDYGAVGNGSTNDRAAIQAAIDDAEAAAGTAFKDVYLPDGDYYIGGTPLTLQGHYVRLIGAGKHTSIVSDNTTMDLLDIGDGTTLYYGIQIRNISFKKTAVSSAGYAIDANYVGQALFEGVQVYGQDMTWNGIRLQSVSQTDLLNCWVYNCVNDGVTVVGVSGKASLDIQFHRCDIQSNGRYGLTCGNYTEGIHMFGVNAWNNKDIGLLMSGTECKNNFVQDSCFDTCGRNDKVTNPDKSGLYVGTCDRLVVTGNWFGENTGDGITLTSNATNVEISGNYLVQNYLNGINIAGDYVNVVGNYLDSNSKTNTGSNSGVYVQGTASCVNIDGNVILNSAGAVTCKHGVETLTGATNVRLSDNLVYNMTAGVVADAATGTRNDEGVSGKVTYYCDFLGANLEDAFSSTVSGTGAAIAAQDQVSGVVRLTSGTGATATAKLYIGSDSLRGFSGSKNAVWEARVRTGTHTATVYFYNGFVEAVNGSNLDYAMFTSDASNSGSWYCLTNNNGNTQTTNLTACSSTAWHMLRIELGATNVRFYIDGILVATHATQVPDEAMIGILNAYQSGGTSNYEEIDAIFIEQER